MSRGSGKPFNPGLAQQLGVQTQQKIMIGLDQGMTASTMNRLAIVGIAKDIYLRMAANPVKDDAGNVVDGPEAQMFCMEQASLQAVALFDRVQSTIDEWNAAKEAEIEALAAAEKTPENTDTPKLEVVKVRE